MNDLSYDLDFWKQWSGKELDRQMGPIYWIVNKDKRETYQNHVKLSIDETTKARERVPCKLDIPYGPQDTQKLDIYGTDLNSSALTFFWVHGGYWKAGERNWSANFVQAAYNSGFKSVVIDYPLAPQARMADMCNSVCEALKKAMSLLPQSVFVVGGHSAGAQLVSSLFHQIPSIQVLPENLMDRIIGAVLMSGPYDMRPAIDIPFVHKTLQLRPGEGELYSPVLTMDKIHSGWLKARNRLSFHISVAEHDPPAIKRFGEVYADMLRKAQFSAEYWISKDEDHFSEVENMAFETSNVSLKLLKFLSTINAKYSKSKL